MEISNQYQAMIELSNCPTFLVKENTVAYANTAAIECGFSIGTIMDRFTPDIFRKLDRIQSGQLHISLHADQQEYSAVISRSGEYDLYYLVTEFSGPELKALAATAGTLKTALSHAMIAAADDNSRISPTLRRSLHQLQRTICNMEDANTINKKRSSQIKACNITEFFDTLLANISQKLTAAGITLEYSGLSRQVISLVDAERLERGIINLIANAITYCATPLTLKTEVRCYSGQIQFSVRTIPTAVSKYAALCSDYRYTIEKLLPESDIALGIAIAKGVAFSHDGAVAIDQPEADCIRLTMTIPYTGNNLTALHSSICYPLDYAGGYDHILVELSYILPETLYE